MRACMCVCVHTCVSTCTILGVYVCVGLRTCAERGLRALFGVQCICTTSSGVGLGLLLLHGGLAQDRQAEFY